MRNIVLDTIPLRKKTTSGLTKYVLSATGSGYCSAGEPAVVYGLANEKWQLGSATMITDNDTPVIQNWTSFLRPCEYSLNEPFFAVGESFLAIHPGASYTTWKTAIRPVIESIKKQLPNYEFTDDVGEYLFNQLHLIPVLNFIFDSATKLIKGSFRAELKLLRFEDSPNSALFARLTIDYNDNEPLYVYETVTDLLIGTYETESLFVNISVYPFE